MASARSVMVAGLGAAALGFGLAMAPLGGALADQAAGDPVKGKAVFASAMCGGCHTLADAGATGPVGPSLDGDSNLTHELVVSRVANGLASMPPFGDQLSQQEIADVAAYVMQAAKK